MRSDKERDMLERQIQKMELNAIYPTAPKIVMDDQSLFDATAVTETGRDILKFTMSSEYGRMATLNDLYPEERRFMVYPEEPHTFIKFKAHTPNPTKRKASKRARKARRNNR